MTPRELWEQYTPYAKAEAARRSRHYSPDLRDDFTQAALLGLWKAAVHWTVEGGASFSSWCRIHVRNELRQEEWRQGFFGQAAGRNSWEAKQPLPQVLRNHMEETVFAEHDPDLRRKVDYDLLDYLLSRLPCRKLQKIVRLHWLEGLLTREVAQQVGLSRSRTRLLHLEALDLLSSLAREHDLAMAEAS